jgi:hypothetical protein
MNEGNVPIEIDAQFAVAHEVFAVNALENPGLLRLRMGGRRSLRTTRRHRLFFFHSLIPDGSFVFHHRFIFRRSIGLPWNGDVSALTAFLSMKGRKPREPLQLSNVIVVDQLGAQEHFRWQSQTLQRVNDSVASSWRERRREALACTPALNALAPPNVVRPSFADADDGQTVDAIRE